MIAGPLIERLDARDRELFVRWSIFDGAPRKAKFFWTTLTHLGGVWFSVASAVFPLGASGPIGAAARRAFAALIVSHVIVQLVKRTVGRPRPSRALNHNALIVEPD